MMSASLPQSNAADPTPPAPPLPLVPEYKPIDDIDLPKPPTCCLCFTPIGYSIGKQTSAGPILCEKCSKRLKRRAEMKRKLQTLIANCEQKMSGGRQKREKVDCLHCGRSFLTKESLWDHMVSARQRLASQCDSNSTSEWMYAISNLLEMQCTDNPLPSDALEESIAPTGKRRSTGCSYSDVIPDYHPSEVESGLAEEDWYLIASEEWGQSSSRELQESIDHADLLDM